MDGSWTHRNSGRHVRGSITDVHPEALRLSNPPPLVVTLPLSVWFLASLVSPRKQKAILLYDAVEIHPKHTENKSVLYTQPHSYVPTLIIAQASHVDPFEGRSCAMSCAVASQPHNKKKNITTCTGLRKPEQRWAGRGCVPSPVAPPRPSGQILATAACMWRSGRDAPARGLHAR
jgi:hypothetical protein